MSLIDERKCTTPLDYSETSAYLKCPAYWWQKYVGGLSKKWEGQRSDALAVGSVFHATIEHVNKGGTVEIPSHVLEEYPLTPEALGLVRDIVSAYVQAYPPHPDTRILGAEQLLHAEVATEDSPIRLCAKVDEFFEVKEDTYLPDGVGGEGIFLNKGVWIQEYKTKASGGRLDTWLAGWEINLQADFQIFCLNAYLTGKPFDGPVKGVLVNTIEKPNTRESVRTCPACKVKLPFYSYTLDGDMYVCNACHERVKLKPPEVKEAQLPTTYRFIITRNTVQQGRAMDCIESVWRRTRNNPFPIYENLSQCVHPIYGRCEYYSLCESPGSPKTDFVKIDPYKYRGEIE